MYRKAGCTDSFPDNRQFYSGELYPLYGDNFLQRLDHIEELPEGTTLIELKAKKLGKQDKFSITIFFTIE